MSGKVYAVASGKGGVGKTTTVVNLGVTLRADDHSVALVDADLGMANLGTFLGIDHEPTLHDVLADEASVDDALVEQVDGFAILPGARDLRQYAAADPRNLGPVLEALSERFEYVLVDTGAGVGFEDVLPLELVDEVLLVASPDRAALGDAGKTAEVSELLGVTVRGVAFTMTDESDDVSAIADKMGVELLAEIPEDSAVPESTASGRPLEAVAPDGPATEGYRELAAALTGRDVQQYEPTGASEEPTGSDDDGAESEAESAAAAKPSSATDTPEEGLEASEPIHDEIGGNDDVDEESPVEADQESATETDAEAGGESPIGSDESTDDESTRAEADEQPGAESSTSGDTETPGDAETESEDTGGEPEDDRDESEEDEAKSGGLLSRLGGLFG